MGLRLAQCKTAFAQLVGLGGKSEELSKWSVVLYVSSQRFGH